MIEILQQHIISRLGNDIDNLETVLQYFKPLYVKRNEFILKEGDLCRHVYFVAKGCLQVYVHDSDMNETTRDIVTEGAWCSELISFGTGVPAAEYIKAIEPCQLLAIDKEGFQKLMQTVPQFDKVYKQVLESSYANAVYRINTFVSMAALDRIKWLMDKRPGLMTRVSGRIIASYLAINKDVFSRLKTKL